MLHPPSMGGASKMRLKRILLATDLSAASMTAERLGAELGRDLGADVVLLFCGAPLDASGFLPASDVAAVVRELDEGARTELGRRARLLRKRGARVREILVAGEASSTIVQTARKLHADLIVLGTHGRSGFSRWTIGSVAERVVRTAVCPVLTVRGAGAAAGPGQGAGRRKRRQTASSRKARSRRRA